MLVLHDLFLHLYCLNFMNIWFFLSNPRCNYYSIIIFSHNKSEDIVQFEIQGIHFDKSMKLYDFISNDYRELISNDLLNHIILKKHYCIKKETKLIINRINLISKKVWSWFNFTPRNIQMIEEVEKIMKSWKKAFLDQYIIRQILLHNLIL